MQDAMFPASAMREERRRREEYRRRCRTLEGALIRTSILIECIRQNLDPNIANDVSTQHVEVDNDGRVQGAAEAVRRHLAKI